MKMPRLPAFALVFALAATVRGAALDTLVFGHAASEQSHALAAVQSAV